jgi:DNA-binding IclR family transcriptional regulator
MAWPPGRAIAGFPTVASLSETLFVKFSPARPAAVATGARSILQLTGDHATAFRTESGPVDTRSGNIMIIFVNMGPSAVQRAKPSRSSRAAAGSRAGPRSSTALRALRVLEAVAAVDRPVSVGEVATRLGLERVAAYRMLVTLVGAGYVLRDVSGRQYRLSHKVVSLSRHLLAENRRTEIVRECLEQIAARTLESVHYAILEGMETVLVQRAKGRQLVAAQFEIGDRSPLHCTSIGKALLAWQDASFVERAIARGLPRVAARTITDARALRAELDRIRAAGYAQDDREFADDMRCVAVPILEPGGTAISGLSISGPIWRFDDAKLAELRDELLAGARRIADRLSGRPPQAER